MLHSSRVEYKTVICGRGTVRRNTLEIEFEKEFLETNGSGNRTIPMSKTILKNWNPVFVKEIGSVFKDEMLVF